MATHLVVLRVAVLQQSPADLFQLQLAETAADQFEFLLGSAALSD
jgi:hypothetical protein